MSLIRKNGIPPEVNNFSNLDIIEDDVGFPDVVVLWAVQGVHEDVLLQVVEGQATVIPLHLPGWCCCCLHETYCMSNKVRLFLNVTFFREITFFIWRKKEMTHKMTLLLVCYFLSQSSPKFAEKSRNRNSSFRINLTRCLFMIYFLYSAFAYEKFFQYALPIVKKDKKKIYIYKAWLKMFFIK